ncbi:MAG: DUF4363 family protein [Oscillospiraceae bacterium]|nr:DUF4363 family protein [Oscillospiraceae bacterium]
MKYLVIGLSILAVILCLCLLFSLLSNRYLDECKAPLLEAESYFPAEDYASILPLLEEAEASWSVRKNFFSCILSHSELDCINYAFARLTAYAEEADMAELRGNYEELLRMLDHIRGMDEPRYYNILSAFVRPDLP